MYLDHFGLREPPFRITPHTEFFFSGANRGATLDALIYAITHDEGIVKVSGEVGSGKTMLCRVLLDRLPEHVVTIYLANPSLDRDDILYAVADELRITLPPAARSAYIIRTLQDHLIGLYGEGRQVVVLIDEAHAMPTETLEEIRLLSNLESNRHKLLQLVMFGQPELNDVLARTDMRQLKERITHNFTLGPLVREDIGEYIDFRLRAAGYKGAPLFSQAAVTLLAKASIGLTRRINILADKSLLSAFAANKREVTPEEVRAAIQDCEFSSPVPNWKQHKFVLGTLAAGSAIAGLTWFFVTQPPATPVTASYAVTAPTSSPLAVPIAVASAPVISNTPPLQQALPAAATQLAPTAPLPAGIKLGPLTTQRFNEEQQWLQHANNEHWFIQILAMDIGSEQQIESVLSKISAQLTAEQIRVYLGKRGNTPRIGIIYGEFETQQAAAKSIATLPSGLQSYHPYPRQIKKLR